MKVENGKLILEDTDSLFVPSGEYVSCLGPNEYTGTFTFEPFNPMDNPTYVKNSIVNQILSLPRKKKKRIKRLLEKGYTMNVTFK